MLSVLEEFTCNTDQCLDKKQLFQHLCNEGGHKWHAFSHPSCDEAMFVDVNAQTALQAPYPDKVVERQTLKWEQAHETISAAPRDRSIGVVSHKAWVLCLQRSLACAVTEVACGHSQLV